MRTHLWAAILGLGLPLAVLLLAVIALSSLIGLVLVGGLLWATGYWLMYEWIDDGGPTRMILRL